MPLIELIGAYYRARREFVERKFARDTQRARLEWLRAKAFAATAGGVTERRNAVELTEELARKGQDLREMTRDVDLAKADVDLIAMIVRLRGAAAEERRRGGAGGARGDGGRRLTVPSPPNACRRAFLKGPSMKEEGSCRPSTPSLRRANSPPSGFGRV